MEFRIREVRRGDLADAQRLADMWNASNDGWPGGWTQGLDITAQQQLEGIERGDHLAVLVVEQDGAFLGYSSLHQTRGRDDMIYLGLLNVRPSHHGTGLGKALLLASLERTVALGKQQLHLGTWAGNLKAVPLYKKTGFFWRPETSVHMENFVPTALQAPLAREFFARHPWYDCFQRELVIAPDDIDWHGTKVYPYRWEADGDLFAMWIDKESQTITAVETNDLYAACYTGLEEVVCGLPHTVTWEFRNKRPENGPCRIAVLAEGRDGVELNVSESVEVTDELRLERTFRVTPDLERRPWGLPERAIAATVLVNGVPVQLGCAVKAVQPLEIEVQGRRLTAGKPGEKVVVKLRNRLDQAVRGEVTWAPCAGLTLDRQSAPFAVPARAWTSCRFAAQVHEDGAYATAVQAVLPAEDNAALPLEGRPLATRRQPEVLHTAPLDGFVAWHDAEAEFVQIETPALAVRLDLRGGAMRVWERPGERQLVQLPLPSVGPPFVHWHQVPPLYEHRLEQQSGRLVLTLVVPQAHLPGVTLERRVTIGSGPFLRLDHRVLNGTGGPLALQLDCNVHSNVGEAITIPYRSGLLHERAVAWGGFPIWGGQDAPKDTSEFAEGWLAQSDNEYVTGVIWAEAVECNRLQLLLKLAELPARATLDAPPIHLVAGRGDWELVRTLWRRLYQPADVREEHRPTALPVLEAAFDPAPALLTGADSAAKLTITNRRGKALKGRWSWAAEELSLTAEGELDGIDPTQRFEHDQALKLDDLRPRVIRASATVVDEVDTTEFATPLVVLGDAARTVACTEADGRFTVDNGVLRYQVAPAHYGALVSLTCDGEELLHCSYPEPRPYLWFNPWYGGLVSFANWEGDQRLAREQFTGEPITRTGARGVTWTGVRTSCCFQHKDFRWLRLDTELLTCGGAAVLAVERRVTNLTDAPQGLQLGLTAWLSEGEGVERVFHYERDRPRSGPAGSPHDLARRPVRRTPTDHEIGGSGPGWVATENLRTGHFLSLVPQQPGAWPSYNASSRDGYNLGLQDWLSLEPGESRARLCWLAVSGELEQARAYGVLGAVGELP